MILEVKKPKRVRFRIKSGQEEHNSLDSLRRDFVWDDVRQLFDGRLEKWLRRINENGIADDVKAFGQPDNTVIDLFRVYNILFRSKDTSASESIAFDTVDDVFGHLTAEAADSRSIALVLAKQIIPMLAAGELLDVSWKYAAVRQYAKPYLYSHAKSMGEDDSPEILYRIGILLCEEDLTDELGQNLLILAADKNHPEADDFIQHHFPWVGKYRAKWLKSLYENPEIRRKLYESWGGESDNHRKFQPLNTSQEEPDLKNLYEFSNTCMKIFKRYSYGNSVDYYEIPEKDFGKFDERDPLYEEKMFILTLFDYEEDSRCQDNLKKIKHYLPAAKMLEDRYFSIDGNLFGLPVYTGVNAKLLKYFVLNLPKFRGVEVKAIDSVGKDVTISPRVSTADINKVLEDQVFIERSKLFWVAKTEMPKSEDSDAENVVIDFINACIRIVNAKDPYAEAVESFYPIGKNRGSGYDDKDDGRLNIRDQFYNEKKFILALFDKNFDMARRNLYEIKDSYEPANRILNSIDKKILIDGYSYQMQMYVRSSEFANNLQYLATNILKFRNYGKKR